MDEDGRRFEYAHVYPVALWNVHERIKHGRPLTTNDIEAYHNKVNKFFHNRKHSNMNEFFRLLQLHQESNRNLMINKSVTEKHRKLVYVRIADNLKKEVSHYIFGESKEERRLRLSLDGYNDPDGSNQRDFLLVIAGMLRYYKERPSNGADAEILDEEKENLGFLPPRSNDSSHSKMKSKPKEQLKMEMFRENLQQMKLKYQEKRNHLLENDLDEEECLSEQPKGVKRKRGRPKGSKNTQNQKKRRARSQNNSSRIRGPSKASKDIEDSEAEDSLEDETDLQPINFKKLDSSLGN